MAEDRKKHFTTAERTKCVIWLHTNLAKIEGKRRRLIQAMMNKETNVDISTTAFDKILNEVGVKYKQKGSTVGRLPSRASELSKRIDLLNARVSQLEDMLTDPKRKVTMPTDAVNGDKNSDPQYCRSGRDQ